MKLIRSYEQFKMTICFYWWSFEICFGLYRVGDGEQFVAVVAAFFDHMIFGWWWWIVVYMLNGSNIYQSILFIWDTSIMNLYEHMWRWWWYIIIYFDLIGVLFDFDFALANHCWDDSMHDLLRSNVLFWFKESMCTLLRMDY